ncbi:large ribosomal subunit protein mL43-like [Oscarella lobularis]|uniref:large ribosomal subunit protein mL43-like n=1 Tax=Oscarella lobularis TaxID=121494 RepID=UPI003313EB01
MSRFVSVKNGFGRYVRQLKRLTLQYCEHGGSSRGMRKYLEKEVNEFIASSPEVAVYVRERPGRHPRLVGEFLNGNSRVVSTRNFDAKQIRKQVNALRDMSGEKSVKLNKWWHTDKPSIQGTWTPFLREKQQQKKNNQF